MSGNLSIDDGGRGECKQDIVMKYSHLGCSVCIASHRVTAIRSIEKPPFPRNETNLCGLQNQGATW